MTAAHEVRLSAKDLRRAYDCVVAAGLAIYDVPRTTGVLAQRLFAENKARAAAAACRLEALAGLIVGSYLPRGAYARGNDGWMRLAPRVFAVAAGQPVRLEDDHCAFASRPFIEALRRS